MIYMNSLWIECMEYTFTSRLAAVEPTVVKISMVFFLVLPVYFLFMVIHTSMVQKNSVQQQQFVCLDLPFPSEFSSSVDHRTTFGAFIIIIIIIIISSALNCLLLCKVFRQIITLYIIYLTLLITHVCDLGILYQSTSISFIIIYSHWPVYQSIHSLLGSDTYNKGYVDQLKNKC